MVILCAYFGGKHWWAEPGLHYVVSACNMIFGSAEFTDVIIPNTLIKLMIYITIKSL